MKKLIMSTFLGTVLTLVAMAQTPAKHDRGQKEKGQHHRMSAMKDLNLSETQKTQLKATKTEFKTKMQALNSNDAQTVKELRESRALLLKEEKSQLDQILTPAQKSQLAAKKSSDRNSEHKRLNKGMEKMSKNLNLTNDQLAILKSNREEARTKMAAVRDNTTLDATSKKEQLKAMKVEMKKSFENVLTSEQKTKLEQMKAEGKNRGINTK